MDRIREISGKAHLPRPPLCLLVQAFDRTPAHLSDEILSIIGGLKERFLCSRDRPRGHAMLGVI